MPTHEEPLTTASESNEAERSDETSMVFSPDLVQEMIKANLEPVHAQISALTQMMAKLIQGYSARDYPTASTGEPHFLSESPFKDDASLDNRWILARQSLLP